MVPDLSTIEHSLSNRSKIFRFIYLKKNTSKQEIADTLNLSLPTVAQALKELYALGIIRRNGYYESTGGRKPYIISIRDSSKIAVGVEMLKESIRISALNLNGKPIKEFFVPISFENSDNYYATLGKLINNFVDGINMPLDSFLGVNLAVQGLVSNDGQTVVSGDILNYTGTTIDAFQKHISLPCRLYHDTSVAALAEIWNQPEIINAAYIVLNQYLGGALIINGNVYHGEEFNGCIIEHMKLIPGGKECYCGQRGCVNTYCSVYSLEQDSGMNISQFFDHLSQNDPVVSRIFDEYLHHLATAINNIRMVFDCEFIIGGLLEEYLTDKYIATLTKYVNDQASFENMKFTLRHSTHGRKAASRGAALKMINEYVFSI